MTPLERLVNRMTKNHSAIPWRLKSIFDPENDWKINAEHREIKPDLVKQAKQALKMLALVDPDPALDSLIQILDQPGVRLSVTAQRDHELFQPKV